MPYVSRDESGTVNGTYAVAQPGYAEEFLPDDDPEVIAFLETVNQPPPSTPPPEDVVLYNHENRIRTLEGQPPLTPEEFAAKMDATRKTP
jgi:hypothetical protein